MPRLPLSLAVFAVFALTLSCSSDDGPRLLDEPPAPVEWLAAGTPYATPLYLIDGRAPGLTVLVLGGVHGDEPGAWQAAEQLVRRVAPPKQGRLLVIPRANALAVEAEVRSTPELGDLNRLYGAAPGVLPMAQVAAGIVDVVRRYEVDVVLDLHESWEPIGAPADDGDGSINTAAVGQTISAYESEPSRSLAEAIVRQANRSLGKKDDFRYLEYPADYEEQVIVPLPAGVSASAVPNRSALQIAAMYPGVASILVEVSQQQSVARRITQHLVVVDALLGELEKRGAG